VDVAALVPSAPVETGSDELAGSLLFVVTKVPSVADRVQVDPDGTPVAFQFNKAAPPSATLVRLDVKDVIVGGTPVTGTLST
jgi:hypothetical protein